MDLDPQLPPLPTLTLSSTILNGPPDKPPDPSISVLFPEITQYRAPDNPFRGLLPHNLEKEHKQALQEALRLVRAPFLFDLEEPINFEGANVDTDTSTENFNAAVITVIAAIERGYYSSRDPTPLGPTDWARLSCALLAAIGRGYHRQYTTEQDSHLEKIRAEVLDPDPLTGNPSLFHRLSAIASDVSDHVGTDQEGYQDWYLTIKKEFTEKATKAAAAEVEEKWRTWKASQIDRLADESKHMIADQAKQAGIDYFIETGQRLGLHITRDVNATTTTPLPLPTIGRKRSISGSLSVAGPATPAMRRILPSTRGTPSPSTTPRGRATTPLTPRATTPLTPQRPLVPPLQPKVTPNPAQTTNGSLNLDAITAVIKAALGPALQSAMAPYVAKIDALERATMPPPRTAQEESRCNTAISPRPTGVGASMWAPTEPAQPPTTGDDGFMPVSRRGKGKRAKGGRNANDPTPAQLPHTNITVSYAGAAAAAANTKQPPPPAPKRTVNTPSITEVTVIRTGGHVDPQMEIAIRERAADAIVREVKLKMSKAVARLIPLTAGRWSVHPRSKGNFVYSFDGNVPFELITTYEHILLAPFKGSGQLSPSMGWTRLLAHGVPTWDEFEWSCFGAEALLNEVKAIPSLKKAHFAMPPRWLKPIDRIESNYSSITFAISDPDGTITSNLLKSRAALFGKDVVIQRWVDKPALVQCSRCHALGHIKTSRACTLGKDSVKCYKCGGSHHTDNHDQCCTRKHAVAGICDCKHFKCINCHNTGHNSKDTRCPARDLFRPRPNRGPRRLRDKGKGKERAMEEDPTTGRVHATLEEITDPDDELYNPAPLPPQPTGREIRTALHDRAIANICNSQAQEMEVDAGTPTEDTYDNNAFPEAWNGRAAWSAEVEYSPSRPQSSAAHNTIA